MREIGPGLDVVELGDGELAADEHEIQESVVFGKMLASQGRNLVLFSKLSKASSVPAFDGVIYKDDQALENYSVKGVSSEHLIYDSLKLAVRQIEKYANSLDQKNPEEKGIITSMFGMPESSKKTQIVLVLKGGKLEDFKKTLFIQRVRDRMSNSTAQISSVTLVKKYRSGRAGLLAIGPDSVDEMAFAPNGEIESPRAPAQLLVYDSLFHKWVLPKK